MTAGHGRGTFGGHFFELFAEDAITEFVITVPGCPKTIQGRDNLAEHGPGVELAVVIGTIYPCELWCSG